MYLDEFEVIWEKQKIYHPEVLTDELKKILGEPNQGVIFFQRPLRSQAFLKGKCSLEP
jgi:CRISPR-associated endonuclease Csn1